MKDHILSVGIGLLLLLVSLAIGGALSVWENAQTCDVFRNYRAQYVPARCMKEYLK